MNKIVDRVVASAVFVYALVLYLLTVSPTVSFWDAGEFIAIAYKLEVSHPPGAPFYMLLGRLFSMFVPTDYVAFSINLISLLASSFTVLLTHLIIVRLVRHWQGPADTWTTGERITALAGGVVGACTFAVTDSFWFNAVEAEVYALSMFFTAIVVWLIMRWSAKARQEEKLLAAGKHPFGLTANRYLVLIAYLFGLALGVHLLNLLAIFFIALIVFFTEYERPDWSTRSRWLGVLSAGAVSAVVFLLIYPGIVQWLPELAGNSGAPLFFLPLVVVLVAFGVYYTHRRQMQRANLAMLCVAVVLIGYSSYALIFIRSVADPPIDENDPETSTAIVDYLKRKQYGQTPLLKGPTYDDEMGRVNSQEETLFPRRYSPRPRHTRVYSQYDSDWDFFWGYQIGHMYLRYFMWNFTGRASDVQDAQDITGFSFIDQSIDTGGPSMQSPSERASRNVYYLLPLLLGLIGMAMHFYNDWRRALSVLTLFLVTGVGIIIYLNQTPLQPRERDYSYVASFFAFSLWVGIGAAGLVQLARQQFDQYREKLRPAAQNGLLCAVGGLLFLAVPFLMLSENYDDHDRSGRYMARDYAYNLLMSLDENAIVFTNGDNDTFPLWYLQEVEGVRTDVRVVNLSLLNTSWYIKQLKNQQTNKSEPLPISFSDERIEQIGPRRWQPDTIRLPVNKSHFLRSKKVDITVRDTSQLESPMTWWLEGRPYSQDVNYLYAADRVALNIVGNVAQDGWTRPVYFAVTVSPSGQLNLQDHFQLEGQAFRVVPIERENQRGMGRIDPEVTPERLRTFRFTNLDDPEVYYNENIRRMAGTYRNIFAHTAEELADLGRAEEGQALLDTLMTKVPFATIPGDLRSYLLMARAYEAVGLQERAMEFTKQAEPLVLQRLTRARSQRAARSANQFVQMLRYTYMNAGNFKAAADFSNRLAEVLGDNSFQTTPAELRRKYQQFAPQQDDRDSTQVRPSASTQ